MFLLDTNVLSELMRSKPDLSVKNWVDRQESDDLFISAVTKAEIGLGLALLPEGKRKRNLMIAADKVLEEFFFDHCLSFDEFAAKRYSSIVAARINKGRPISVEDAQIASIALTHNMILTTRNIKDFEEIKKLQIINPWDKELQETT